MYVTGPPQGISGEERIIHMKIDHNQASHPAFEVCTQTSWQKKIRMLEIKTRVEAK